MINTLPEFARAIAEPLSNVENIRILDGGNGEGVNSLSNGIISQMANAEEGLNQMTGFNLTQMLENISNQKKTYAFEQNESSSENEGSSENNDLESEEAPLKDDIDQTEDMSNDEK